MNRQEKKDRLDEIIGKNIRVEREARNFSRDELARLLEITPSHLGLIERGERGTTTVTLMMLSRAFGLPIDEIFHSKNKKGSSINDGEETNTQSNRDKLQSLATCLDNHELEFCLRMVKALIAMNHAIEAED